MLGKIDPKHREVTVVGAGIAGLLAADALDREGYVVTLIEASDRGGGLISTRQTEFGIVESAAHSIQATPAVLKLCEELGVELVPVRDDSKARFVWRGGRLRRFPLSPMEVLGAFFRAYFVLADRSLPAERVTLAQWASRFLGDAALDYLVTPFVRGIYGARPSEISVDLAFPALKVPHGHSLLSKILSGLLRKRRGEKRSRPRMMAPREGMGAITRALESRLESRLGERFKKGVRLDRIPDAPNIVLCVPAASAAEMLSKSDPATSDALLRVRYTPLVSVTVFANRESFARPPKGVGVLLPEGTSRKCLGVLFNSSSFPERVKDESQSISLTMMLGGSSHPEILRSTDQELSSLVRGDLEALFGLKAGASLEMFVSRWERAVPQYNDTLRGVWETAAQNWCAQPGRALFGNYTGQVSVRGMIESVDSGAFKGGIQ